MNEQQEQQGAGAQLAEIDIADKLVIIRVVTTAFSGKQALQPADLGAGAAAALPPSSLVGINKRIVDPGSLKAFAKLRQRAMRACLLEGTRVFGDSFAVPEAKATNLLANLAIIEHEWEQAVVVFLNSYTASILDWANAHQEWRAALLARAPTEQEIASRFGFRVVPFRVRTDVSDSTDALHKELGGLAGQLLYEVATEARAAYAVSFEHKVEVTRRALRPVKSIIDKVCGLAFLSRGVAQLASYLESVLAAIPTTGPITANSLLQLATVLDWLGNPENPRKMFFTDKPTDSGALVAPAFEQTVGVAVAPAVPAAAPQSVVASAPLTAVSRLALEIADEPGPYSGLGTTAQVAATETLKVAELAAVQHLTVIPVDPVAPPWAF